MKIEIGATYTNKLGVQLHIEAQVIYCYGNPVLGNVYEAKQIDELGTIIGIYKCLVTPEGLEACGYEKNATKP